MSAFAEMELEDTQHEVLRAPNKKYIWKSQQQCLFTENHEPATQDNPQTYLPAGSFWNYYWGTPYNCAEG